MSGVALIVGVEPHVSKTLMQVSDQTIPGPDGNLQWLPGGIREVWIVTWGNTGDSLMCMHEPRVKKFKEVQCVSIEEMRQAVDLHDLMRERSRSRGVPEQATLTRTEDPARHVVEFLNEWWEVRL